MDVTASRRTKFIAEIIDNVGRMESTTPLLLSATKFSQLRESLFILEEACRNEKLQHHNHGSAADGILDLLAAIDGFTRAAAYLLSERLENGIQDMIVNFIQMVESAITKTKDAHNVHNDDNHGLCEAIDISGNESDIRRLQQYREPPTKALDQAVELWTELGHHGTDVSRQLAAKVLARLSALTPNSTPVAAAGIVSRIVPLLSDATDETRPAIRVTSRYLFTYCRDYNVPLTQAGGIPLLLLLLRDGALTETAKEQAVSALKLLTARKADRKLIMVHGGIPVLIQLLRVGSEVTKAQAVATLTSLLSSEPSGGCPEAMAAVPLLVQLLAEATADTDSTKRHAKGILRSIAVHTEYRRAILAAGAASHLITLGRGSRADIREQAEATMRYLDHQASSKPACVGVGGESDAFTSTDKGTSAGGVAGAAVAASEHVISCKSQSARSGSRQDGPAPALGVATAAKAGIEASRREFCSAKDERQANLVCTVRRRATSVPAVRRLTARGTTGNPPITAAANSGTNQEVGSTAQRSATIQLSSTANREDLMEDSVRGPETLSGRLRARSVPTATRRATQTQSRCVTLPHVSHPFHIVTTSSRKGTISAATVAAKVSVTAANAPVEDIPQLVQKLWEGSTDVRAEAVAVLRGLAADSQHRAAIAAAGAVAPLVRLLRDETAATRGRAAGVVRRLAEDPVLRSKIAVATDVIPSLLQLLREGRASAKAEAAGALGNLAAEAGARRAIVSAGAIPFLVHLLKEGTASGKEQAAVALWSLVYCDRAAKEALKAEHPKEALRRLEEQGGTVSAREHATKLLRRLKEWF